MKLDSLDKKLLFQLDMDARQPLTKIARSLHVARDRVEYRYERLLHSGLIRQTTVAINPYQLGLTIYKTYLRVSRGRAHYRQLVQFLNAHPQVYWIAECDGRWDLMYALFARSAFEFHTLQREILNGFREVILSSNVYILVNVWMYPKRYLTGQQGAPFLVGGQPANYPLDELEWNILRCLSRDGRASVPDIARLVKSTEATVRNRIAKMESGGLIARYRVELDYQKAGMIMCKAQLFLSQDSSREVARLKRYCADHPHISYYIEQVGECELEIELEVDGLEHYGAIIQELREKFARSIRNVETSFIQRGWFKWVPYAVVGGA